MYQKQKTKKNPIRAGKKKVEITELTRSSRQSQQDPKRDIEVVF